VDDTEQPARGAS